MTGLTLTWTPVDDFTGKHLTLTSTGAHDVISRRLTLEGSPDVVGAAYWRSHVAKPHGYAMATIRGRFLFATARTVAGAIRALERQIDRQSIGLLGLDDVTFKREGLS